MAIGRNFWAALGFEGRSQPMTKKICKHYLEKTNENAYFKANLNKNGGFGGRSPPKFFRFTHIFSQNMCIFRAFITGENLSKF